MSWPTARAELKALLATVAITSPITQTIKKVYEFPPGAIQDKPCFIIYPPAITIERRSGGWRSDRYRVRVALLVQDADKDRAAELVSAYIDKVTDLIDANVTLNGTATVVNEQETEEGTAIAYGGLEYPGCITFLTIRADFSTTFSP